jgi:hypothetical protein
MAGDGSGVGLSQSVGLEIGLGRHLIWDCVCVCVYEGVWCGVSSGGGCAASRAEGTPPVKVRPRSVTRASVRSQSQSQMFMIVIAIMKAGCSLTRRSPGWS